MKPFILFSVSCLLLVPCSNRIWAQGENQRNRIKVLESECSVLQEKRTKAYKEVITFKTDIGKEKKNVSGHTKAAEDERAELAKTIQDISELRSLPPDAANRDSGIAQLNSKVSAIQSRIATANSKATDAQGRVVSLTTELRAKETELEGFVKEIKDREKQISELYGVLRELGKPR